MKKPWKTLFLWEAAAVLGLVVILAAVLLPALARSGESSHRASCQNNLKQLGLVMKMYANESKGERYPPLSPTLGNWMMDMATVYPEYLTDGNILVCPSSPLRAGDDIPFRSSEAKNDWDTFAPDCVSHLFYTYIGYSLICDEQALAFFEGYCRNPALFMAQSDIELNVPIWQTSDRPTSAGQASIPIMWDRVTVDPELRPHIPDGGNVLYMDGHVNFERYSPYNNASHFPMTRLTVELFSATLPRLPPHCYQVW